MKDSNELTAMDICWAVRKAIINKAAEIIAYSWPDEFSVKELRGVEESITKQDAFFKVDPNDLSSDDMDTLGFGSWDEESDLRLIPLWLLPYLADEFQGGSISGEGEDAPYTVKRSEMDNDHRFGMLAYGIFKPKS